MCPASTTVVLGHRCHLLQQAASHKSPSPTTCKQPTTPEAKTSGPQCCCYLDWIILSCFQNGIKTRVTIKVLCIKYEKCYAVLPAMLCHRGLAKHWHCKLNWIKHCWLVGWLPQTQQIFNGKKPCKGKRIWIMPATRISVKPLFH